MAKVNIDVVKTEKPNELSSDFDLTSASASDEIIVPFDGKDHQTYFVVTAAAACTITVKAGNGLQGVTDRDYAIKANKHSFFSLDSGYHKNVSGENKGKVVLIPNAACKIAVLEARV